MPTFPRSPLSFRTAGFPQYGWKAGLSGGAFPVRQRLKPAPGIRLLTAGLPSPFVHLIVKAVAPYCAGPLTMMMHRLGGWVALRPRGPRSGPGCSVPVRHHLIGPIRPTHGHIAISPHGGLYAMPSLCGSASATREWFRAFAAIPSRHAVLSDPREFDIACPGRDAELLRLHSMVRRSTASGLRDCWMGIFLLETFP